MPVTKMTITSRQPYAGGQEFGDAGAYEQIEGQVHFSVDPAHEANERIADIELAPRGPDGRASFSSDFRLLAPVNQGKGNRRLLLDVPNRGRPLALKNLNSSPDAAPGEQQGPGNGFLMRYGYTIAWCGWQHDVPEGPGMLRIQAPQAMIDGEPVSGKVVVTFQPNAPTKVQHLSDRAHLPYPCNNLEDWDSTLTVQEHEDAPEQAIPRDQWSFARLDGDRRVPDPRNVYMESGFQPGKVYQVIYNTTGAPIAGAGLLATRDIASFLRYAGEADGNPCAGGIDAAYSFGVSQSGRFLRHFLYLGLNLDEEGRPVFDGFIPHVAGGKRGEFNHRFAQPSSQASRSPNSLFPFSDEDQTDPETGLTDGLLSRLTSKGNRPGNHQGNRPKIMYVNTPSEYWGGHGALLHTEINGERDITPPEWVRIYMLGGTQHAVDGLPLADRDAANEYRAQQLFNCLDYRPLLRAALVNLDRWATSDEAPPPSAHPKLSEGTGVSPESVMETFRSIPGVGFPGQLRKFTRLDFGPDPRVPTVIPARVGGAYPRLVSGVDADGNEVSGVPLPFVTVPLATYTGWNMRHRDIGGDDQVLSSGGASGGTLKGSTIPFPATRKDREAAGDPRRSIEERYASRDDYAAQVKQAGQALVSQGYALTEDLDTFEEQGRELYDALAGGVEGNA